MCSLPIKIPKKLTVDIHRIRFIGSTSVFGHPVGVKVFQDGTVCISFKGRQYTFEKTHLFISLIHIIRNMTYQLFTHENVIVLFLGNKFEYFHFENEVFSKAKFSQHPSSIYKCFFKSNHTRILCAGKRILSFTLENGTLTKRHYPIRHGIDGGILTLVNGTPYFVCCIHPPNFPLIVVSINLPTGQQNTVLKMEENDHFNSFKHMNGKLFLITNSRVRGNKETEVDPRTIHDTRKSWRQDGGIIWENLFENVVKLHQSKITFTKVLKELMEKTNKYS